MREIGILLMGAACLAAQDLGTLRGKVTLEAGGEPVAHVTVLIVQLGRHAETNGEGNYELRQVPAGKYDVLAHMHPLGDARRSVEVAAGGTAVADFRMKLAPVRESITVTASGKEETTLEAFQSVLSMERLDLAPLASASLGEALDHETGVAKRSFGPGTSRPVVRGFDGDRVAILQDGMSTGTLSSQSGDHGEPVDVTSADRIEVVRGPATLLYGTNALGGVVNVITGHHQAHPHGHAGVRGYLSGNAGTNHALGGGNGGIEVGGKGWMLLANGGGLRTGEYRTPLGKVHNSETEIRHTTAGLGRYFEHGFLRFSYGVFDGKYGIPPVPGAEDHEHDVEEHERHEHEHDHEEGPVDEKWRRHNLRLEGGLQDLGSFLDHLNLQVNYSDWNHREMVLEDTHTRFFNKVLGWRGVLEHKRRGPLSGSFGASGLYRRYKVVGEEALTPPVTQNATAAFGLEQLNLERFRVQFGGRLENNRYRPQGLPGRSFTGFSGSVGVNAGLWTNGSMVASYSRSYRAPAIEELYNVGPHPGNMAFEIGNPGLKREKADGVELGLRHHASRARGEVNLFYYRLGDYVYMAPTGEFEAGFVKAMYLQGDSRYMGAEAKLELGLHRDLWLRLGLDSVDAQLLAPRVALPRIPPVRGRAGLEFRRGGFSLRPELWLANAQQQLYYNETRTAGYATGQLLAGYSLVRKHTLHSVGVSLFNLGDRLYRNHVSLIKDFAPEIGRGVRFSYTVQFF